MKVATATRLGLALTALLSAPWPSLAHKGGVDQYGCHSDDKAGGYHCHKGLLAGLSFRSRRDLLDAMDQPRHAPGDMPAAPQVSPPAFEPLRGCSEATFERQHACFQQIAPPATDLRIPAGGGAGSAQNGEALGQAD
jgi:hypothetical protein